MVRPCGPVDDSEVLGDSEPKGDGTSGGETDVLNAAVTNLARQGRGHASGLFQLGRNLFKDRFLLGVVGQQKAIPPGKLLGIGLVDLGQGREPIDAHAAQFYWAAALCHNDDSILSDTSLRKYWEVLLQFR